MSRRTAAVDRCATVLAGLVLVAAGLLLLDWRTGTVLDLPATADLGGVRDVLATAWWPWAAAVAGILVALVGVVWLVAHLPHRGPAGTRLSGSDPTGTLEVDLRAVAGSVADRLEELGPVTSARGSTTRLRGRSVLQVRARLAAGADPTAVADAVRRCAGEVDEALAGEVALRVLLDAPGRARRTDDRVRVQ